MNVFWAALRMELLKLKRSLALWVAFLAPAVMIALTCIMLLGQDRPLKVPGGGDPWEWFTSQTVQLWSLLMLPLVITLEMALLAAMEHGDRHWKQLFALPVPRSTIYLAKLVSGMLLMALSSLALALADVLGGFLVGALRPEVHLSLAVPWLALLTYVGPMYLGAWLTIAIQTWVSNRWPNFALACGVGIAASITGIAVGVQGKSEAWARFWPWLLPYFTLASDRKELTLALTLGIAGGLAFAVFGCWNVVRRDVA